MRSACVAIASLAWLLTAPGIAQAGSHLWRFSEFYSSPDRSIQFIEMQEIGNSNNETNISEHWYQTDSYNLNHSQLLGTDLPTGTAGKTFLVGTQSYAALPGVPAPDYVLPDAFFEPDGDTIHWWTYQTKAIPVGVMPSDGTDSLFVVTPSDPSSGFSVGTNSPKNFNDVTGTVVLPAAVPAFPSSAWRLAIVLVGSLLVGAALVRRSRAS